MQATARQLIDRLQLRPHPEGGWYRETCRTPGPDGGRGVVTAIHFLLEPGQRSHWHRVDATEIWLHQAGGAVHLRIAAGGEITAHRLGPDVMGGDVLQAVVAAGRWQAAAAGETWALVACVVAPAFEFSGFELAPPGWAPDGPIGPLW